MQKITQCCGASLISALLVSLSAVAAVPIPAPPDLPVRSHILIEFDSGRVLASLNADQKLEPASLTKLMTAYAVFVALREGRLLLTDDVVISEKAWRMEGSRSFIEVGKHIPAEVLIKGMIVQSGNDASIAPGAGYGTTFVADWSREPLKIGANKLGAGVKVTDSR